MDHHRRAGPSAGPHRVDLTPEWLPTAETTFNILGALASLVAIFAFVPWASQQRRRPELEMLWKIAPTGDVDDLAAWAPGTVAEVPHGPVIVEASVLNVGDATATVAESNFYVPGALGLERWRGDEDDSPNPDAEPYPIRFLPKTFAVAPGNWFQQRFRLSVPDDPGQPFPAHVRSERGTLECDRSPVAPEPGFDRWGRGTNAPGNTLAADRSVTALVAPFRVGLGTGQAPGPTAVPPRRPSRRA